MRPPERHQAAKRGLTAAFGAAVATMLVAGCNAPFAGSEAAALQGPPTSLTDGQRAFWNDLRHQSFGMVELGAHAYRYGPDICKIALESVIDNGRQQAVNTAFLYCAASDGVWHVRPGVVCRPATSVNGAACRDEGRDYTTLPLAD